MWNFENYSESELRLKYWLFRSLLFLLIFFTIAFLSIGLITLSIGGDDELCTESVTATVTENIKSEHIERYNNRKLKRTIYTYAPVYSYAYNGREYSVESSNSTKPAKYDVGDTAVIMVNPDNPAEIYEPEFKKLEVTSIIYIIVGVCIFLACIADIICLIRVNKRLKILKTDK